MKKRVYRINGDDVRLIIPPGCTLLDDMRWLRFVICTPSTPFKPVNKSVMGLERLPGYWDYSFLIAGSTGLMGILGRAVA